MMNKGDSYVLDVPEYNKTIVWRGANSNRCNDVQHESFKSSSTYIREYFIIYSITFDIICSYEYYLII